jgi:hypothetical protein
MGRKPKMKGKELKSKKRLQPLSVPVELPSEPDLGS